MNLLPGQQSLCRIVSPVLGTLLELLMSKRVDQQVGLVLDLRTRWVVLVQLQLVPPVLRLGLIRLFFRVLMAVLVIKQLLALALLIHLH
jgi:hypothetical protein